MYVIYLNYTHTQNEGDLIESVCESSCDETTHYCPAKCAYREDEDVLCECSTVTYKYDM